MKLLTPIIHVIRGEATSYEAMLFILELTLFVAPFILIFGNHLK